MHINPYSAILEDEFINQAGALFQTYRVTGPDGVHTVGRVHSDQRSSWMVRNEDGHIIGSNSDQAHQMISACLRRDPALEVV